MRACRLCGETDVEKGVAPRIIGGVLCTDCAYDAFIANDWPSIEARRQRVKDKQDGRE